MPVDLYPGNRSSRVPLRMLGPEGEPLSRHYYSQKTGDDLEDDEWEEVDDDDEEWEDDEDDDWEDDEDDEDDDEDEDEDWEKEE